MKIASTGVLVFVIGAGMATIGSTLKTEYQTLGVPSFSDGESEPESDVDSKKLQRLSAIAPAIQWCDKNVRKSRLNECVADAVRKLSK